MVECCFCKSTSNCRPCEGLACVHWFCERCFAVAVRVVCDEKLDR